MFQKKDVIQVYEQYIKINNTPEYLGRYDDFYFNNFPLANTINFPRIICVLEFERLVKKLGLSANVLYNFNGDIGGDPECQCIPYKSLKIINYDEETEANDLHKPLASVGGDNPDFIIVSQTFEHTYNPFLCMQNLFDLLAPGGYMFSSVPVVNHLHSYPFNFFSGFTPVGFTLLFLTAGFEVIEVGQWGNRKYIQKMFNSWHWAVYRNLRPGFRSRTDFHNLQSMFKDGTQNEFNYPCDCWIMARKPR